MSIPSVERPLQTVRAAERITLTGLVQGCGMRPALVRHAEICGLSGTISNTDGGVVLELEGEPRQLAMFAHLVEQQANLPTGSRVESLRRDSIAPMGASGVSIIRERSVGPIATSVPADVRICSSCLKESAERGNRRFTYPLTTCSSCGPRFSVIRSMPFERDQTSMIDFPLCDECRREYTSPAERRFHAQTTSCPRCGPRVWAKLADGSEIHDPQEALKAVVSELRRGRIAAIRGVGGYQLLVNAESASAVNRLRERKHRPAKPLAVMVLDLKAAEEVADLSAVERETLSSAANPIVIVRTRRNRLAPEVNSGLPHVGLMLPTTAMHDLILRSFERPLVCTSGNREGEPLEVNVESAERNLHGISDIWLHHDRPIVHPIDDSVVRVIAGRPVALRLARGYAPFPLPINSNEQRLATGGHMKSALAWHNGKQAVLGPHIGDLDTLGTRERYLDSIVRMKSLYRFDSPAIIHDQHPEYFSTSWAVDQSASYCSAQHHHAHIAAGMVEYGWLDRTVLGISWDGTGYGDDGSIWGSEFLLCDIGGYQRVASLRTFCLPGGDAAAREPWRVAATLIAKAAGTQAATDFPWKGISPRQVRFLLESMKRAAHSPLTTSAGRFFDAAACLILGEEFATFEAGPAMLLEAVADQRMPGIYSLPIDASGSRTVLDWRPLIRELLVDLTRDTDRSTMAIKFHRALAEGIAAICDRHRDPPIVLGGGVFQNRLLVELLADRLSGRELALPGMIPPGDGGLAAGQLAISAHLGES